MAPWSTFLSSGRSNAAWVALNPGRVAPTFDGDTITPCLISVFEAVELARPKKGIDPMRSLSLRFRRE